MPPAVRRLASIAAVLLGALALAVPAFAANAGLTPVDPKSPNAQAINDTYYLLLGITGVVFVLVQGALIAFLIRYRRRRRPVDAEGPQIHGNTKLEILWTVIPVLLVAVIVWFVVYKLPEISAFSEDASAAPDEVELRIDVAGRQFYWEFQYPDGSVTYDRLVVPVDRTVELDVTAPDHDVVHSWWVPALGGKIDAIPGVVNHTWFRAEEPGEYAGTCGEFCGIQHNAMSLTVVAVPADEYEDERARVANSGRAYFEAACAKCHNLEGPQLIGPSLEGNPLLSDPEGLAELVRNGRNEMPPVGRGWTDEQIETLLEFTSEHAGGGE
jgi:cytochrome c oxidase subunit II